MTRVSRDFGDTMQKEAVPASTSSHFPSYKIGSNVQIADAREDPKVLSMKEVVTRETILLLEQQQRLSVRDLASKFEKGLAVAAKLSEEAKLREVASLEKHILLKKLRDALESLKGMVATAGGSSGSSTDSKRRRVNSRQGRSRESCKFPSAAKKALSFVLAFESAREIEMLARRFAFDCNVP